MEKHGVGSGSNPPMPFEVHIKQGARHGQEECPQADQELSIFAHLELPLEAH